LHDAAGTVGRDLGFRHEEPDLDPFVRQQRQHRLVGRRPLARLEEDILDAAGRRRLGRDLAGAGLGPSERGLRLADPEVGGAYLVLARAQGGGVPLAARRDKFRLGDWALARASSSRAAA
jgi:hypothetical protein